MSEVSTASWLRELSERISDGDTKAQTHLSGLLATHRMEVFRDLHELGKTRILPLQDFLLKEADSRERAIVEQLLSN